MKVYDQNLPHYWRHTFLRQHVQEILASTHLIQTYLRPKILPDFFNPLPGDIEYYIDLRVLPVDERATPISSSYTLSQLVQEQRTQRILLVGNPGGGKTVSLLKVFFDCTHKSGLLSEAGFVPLYLNWVHLRPLEEHPPLIVELQALINKAAKHEMEYDCFARFQSMPNTLILLDGLDEIRLEIRDEIDQLIECLDEFIENLSHDYSIILACRKQEAIRDTGSLISRIREGCNFQVFQLCKPPLNDMEEYFRRAIPNELFLLLTGLSPQEKDILQNLYVMGYFVGQAHRRYQEYQEWMLIYYDLIERWISSQFHPRCRALRSFDREGCRRGPIELLKQIASQMDGSTLYKLSESVLGKIIRESQTEDWYPKRNDGNPIDSQTILKEILSSGLLTLL